MSIVGLGMDGLLALLLVAALVVGLRLNRRLVALRDGQATFVRAVADLDAAALRAEVGLASLRDATLEAHDQLLDRIETARTLAARLEGAVGEAQAERQRIESAAAARPAASSAPSRDARPAEPGPTPPPIPAEPAGALARFSARRGLRLEGVPQ